MPDESLRSHLESLPLGGWRYEDSIGSTNDEAMAWVEAGGPDLCLVIADQQTKGRGRFQRRWITNPGAALAFSLAIRPAPHEIPLLTRFSPLGALAIWQALGKHLGLSSEIKWPNDILLNQQKVAGILVENAWSGAKLLAVIIGIGINIAASSVPLPGEVMFPATCLETILGRPVDRWALLHEILASLIAWRSRLDAQEILATWEDHLAFKGQWVRISGSSGPEQIGQVLGLDQDGSLRLLSPAGDIISVSVGDVSLRSTSEV